MPGANERALEKAKALEADSLILDLEDSVAPDAKAEARAKVAAAVKAGGYGRRELVIRINGLDTPWGVEDLKMAAEVNPDAILVPKVARPGDIVNVSKIHAGMGGAETTRMWAMMETPMAIFNVREIASVHQVARLSCLVLGTNDLLKESRALATGGRFAILPWLSMTLLAARAYGLDVIDGVYNDFRDEQGFRAECEQGRTLGMDGKTLIHPGQIAACNELFSPAPEEVAWSRKIIAAFSAAGECGEGRHHRRRQDGGAPAPRHGGTRGGHCGGDRVSIKTNPGNFFEDFRLGQTIRHATPRTVTAGDQCALHRTLWLALRRAVVRCLRAGRRLSRSTRRRSPHLPHRLRQDGAGHLAQCGGQSRLCRLPLPEAGLSGRHALDRLRGDRPQGEFQRQDRHRLCALGGLEPAGRGGALLCALGDGAEAR